MGDNFFVRLCQKAGINIDPRIIAVIYLLSNVKREEIIDHVTSGRILFDELFEISTCWSYKEQQFIRVAAALYPSSKFDIVVDKLFNYLNREERALVLTALNIYYQVIRENKD